MYDVVFLTTIFINLQYCSNIYSKSYIKPKNVFVKTFPYKNW